MRRRRPLLRRGIFSNRPAGPLILGGRGARQIRIEAHQMMVNGNYLAAAKLFDSLLEAVQARGNLQALPRLHLLAGRAHLMAGNPEQGTSHLRQGLELMAESGRWAVLYKAGNMVVNELKRADQPAASAQIKAWLDQKLRNHPEAAQQLTPEKQPSAPLPEKCPFCGADLRPNEVDWLDDRTAECTYCGSSVQVDA